MRNEQAYKEEIKKRLDKTLAPGHITELGEVYHGKVRDVYMKDDKVIMVATDNLSTFDHVMENLIPYKWIVLNMFAHWAFESVKDIIPSAMLGSPDPNVVIQKKLKNVGVEGVVRWYVWWRIAVAYEKGERDFCWYTLPEWLIAYEQLEQPLFTPTTKYEKSDRNLTQADVEELVGKDMADLVREKALALYKRWAELAKKQWFVLIDTKYEFGLDENNVLHLIDEMHTPDSSRYCTVEEWNTKFPLIQQAMNDGHYANVSELITAHPHLKIKEYSKQFVRDVVAQWGVVYKDGKIVAEQFPVLTDEQVIEVVYRYVSTYEDVTWETFDFSILDEVPQERLMKNLREAGLIG